MSFGYLIITSNPCPALTKTRGETFDLISQKPQQSVYFRWCESGFYTDRIDVYKAVLNDKGVDFLQRIYQANGGSFIFADVLLQKRESEASFAERILAQINHHKLPVIQAETGLRIDLRQAYRVETGKALNR